MRISYFISFDDLLQHEYPGDRIIEIVTELRREFKQERHRTIVRATAFVPGKTVGLTIVLEENYLAYAAVNQWSQVFYKAQKIIGKVN